MSKSRTFSTEQIEELKAAKKKNKNKNVDKRLNSLLLRAESKSRKKDSSDNRIQVYISDKARN